MENNKSRAPHFEEQPTLNLEEQKVIKYSEDRFFDSTIKLFHFNIDHQVRQANDIARLLLNFLIILNGGGVGAAPIIANTFPDQANPLGTALALLLFFAGLILATGAAIYARKNLLTHTDALHTTMHATMELGQIAFQFNREGQKTEDILQNIQKKRMDSEDQTKRYGEDILRTGRRFNQLIILSLASFILGGILIAAQMLWHFFDSSYCQSFLLHV